MALPQSGDRRRDRSTSGRTRLAQGPEHLRVLREGLERWMEEREYASIAQLRGSMSLARCPDPRAFERGGYMRVLQTWRRDEASMRVPRPS